MTELHTSPSQLLMTAEANDIYIPALLELNGMDANRWNAASWISGFEREQVLLYKVDKC